jgi:hypothetical protein
MDSLESVRRILTYRKRSDLADLLSRARLELEVSNTYGSYLFSLLTAAEIYVPIHDYERLRALPQKDQDLILQALVEVHPPKNHEIEVTQVEFRLEPSSPSDYLVTDDELLRETEAQRNLMIAAATGGPRINTVNDEYQRRRDWIRAALKERGFLDPNPYADLWAWYGKWSSGDLPTYKSRRQYISGLYERLDERIRQGTTPHRAEIFEEPTGWARVDRGLGEIRKRLEEALAEEQFQAVGLLCRETLISLAQIVYDPSLHDTADGVTPSETDAKRMLEAYLGKELGGRTNEVARRHARAALALANDLQHRRTASFRQAALCAAATASVVNLIAIISGQRDP